MLWGGRELLLTEAYDCCLINTKAAKFCCSPPVNFSSTFCLYHLCMEIFGLGKGSIFHGTCLFCCASERNLYTLTGVEMLQQCKAAMVLYGRHGEVLYVTCMQVPVPPYICMWFVPAKHPDRLWEDGRDANQPNSDAALLSHVQSDTLGLGNSFNCKKFSTPESDRAL